MADRYWVGGTSSWVAGNTANWSATSGGAGGASVPTAADNVFFDSASASGNYTVTVSTANTPCGDLNVAKPASGTFTFAGSANMTCSGSLNIVATGVTWTYSGTLQFTLGSSGILSRTVNTGGLTLVGIIFFNAIGVTWQFQGPVATAGGLQATNGTIDLNNFDFTGVSMNCGGSSSKTFAFGSSGRIVLTGNNTTVWANQIANGLFLTGTPNVTFNYAGAIGTRTIAQGLTIAGTAAQVPNFNITAGTDIVSVSAQARDLNFTGFSGTLSTNSRTLFGNLTLSATMTVATSTGATTFAATTGTQVITTNGRVVDFPVTFNGVGGTVQLADNYTGGTTATSVMNLANGTVDFNGKTVNIFGFVSANSNIRRIIATGASLNIFGNAATVLNFATVANFTLTDLGTITFTYVGAVGNRTITAGGFTEARAFNIVVTGGSDQVLLGGSMRDLDLSGFSGTFGAVSRTLFGNLTLGAATTMTNSAVVTEFANTTGTITINCNDRDFAQAVTFSGIGGTRQLLGNMNLAGRNFTLSAGTLDLNGFVLTAFVMNAGSAQARQIEFGTTGVINLTGTAITVWSCATATGFGYTGNARVNLTGNVTLGTRTITHGSTAGGTFATKAPPIYITAGTDTVSTTDGSHLSDLVFAATPTLSATSRIIYGNLILAPTQVLNGGAGVTTFAGPGTQTFESAQSLCNFPITIGNSTSNGTVVLANALTVGTTRALTLTSGTLDLQGYSLSTGVLLSSGTNTRALNISNATVTLVSTGTVFNAVNTGFTVTAANSNIVLSNETTTARTFAGGGLTYGNLIIGGATGISTTTFTGNNTFDRFTSTKTVAHTLLFTAGTTTTVDAFTVTGTANNIVTIGSTTTAQHNLVLTSGQVNTVDYLNISYSNASPATDTWFAGTNSIDSGNNTGWIFPVAGSSSNFFLVF